LAIKLFKLVVYHLLVLAYRLFNNNKGMLPLDMFSYS
jgi:hypothetical protein